MYQCYSLLFDLTGVEPTTYRAREKHDNYYIIELLETHENKNNVMTTGQLMSTVYPSGAPEFAPGF
jgi:hypothetical protein